MQLNDITELLRQAYMDSNWDSVLEAIDILQQEEDQEEYGDDQDSIGSYSTQSASKPIILIGKYKQMIRKAASVLLAVTPNTQTAAAQATASPQTQIRDQVVS